MITVCSNGLLLVKITRTICYQSISHQIYKTVMTRCTCFMLCLHAGMHAHMHAISMHMRTAKPCYVAVTLKYIGDHACRNVKRLLWL